MPDISLLRGAQDAIRAQNITDGQTLISRFLVESGCTGAINAEGLLIHDGDSCSIHESTHEHLLREARRILPHGMGAPSVDDLATDIEDLRDVLIALIEQLPNL